MIRSNVSAPRCRVTNSFTDSSYLPPCGAGQMNPSAPRPARMRPGQERRLNLTRSGRPGVVVFVLCLFLLGRVWIRWVSGLLCWCWFLLACVDSVSVSLSRDQSKSAEWDRSTTFSDYRR